ncbi:bacterioopsin transcriptional activator [Halalkalicoccus paucihalophilus]|uniref:histidine kinase n=1 Tax=Halalkalicoccus paucihalophilus TaxID=1008153 RepID=A0A151ABR2_9EURY|nr:ATP-binding protein [Halalkalicoccus paucihalophilus]KYH25053.1 bacterioopsin transcriptional activator [Halalkalicoccus paucihalophilus]
MSDTDPPSPPDELRILYVDDDTEFAETVADGLEREDDRFTVTTASTAADGFDRLSTDAIDCIVSEYDLPRMDGIEFLEAVRDTSGRLPFVLLTEAGSEGVASDAIGAGVTDYIPKHRGADRFRMVAERVSRAVERSREHREHRDRRRSAVETARTDSGRPGVDGRSDFRIRNATDTDREREFQRTSALLSTLFATLPVGVLAEDGHRNVMAINHRLIDLFGIPHEPAEIVGRDCQRMAEAASESMADPAGFLDRIDELIAEGESVRREELSLADGRTFERSYRPIDCPSGDGHLWVYHDSTERTTYEHRLEVLNETTRELMAVDSFEAIAEIGVTAARDILGLDANAIHLYDDARSGLVPITATDALSDLVGEPPTFTGEGSIAWRVYDRAETLALDDVREDPDVYNPETAVTSELYLPIGEYGLLIAGSPTSETFDGRDVALGEILAANVAAALEQVEQTDRLRARERELERQNDRLEEFTSVVSHDLQNPLSVAAGHLDLAMEEVSNERLEAVARAHDRMQALITDLLAVAREGEAPTDVTVVSLAAIAEQCWQNVETGEAALVVETDRTVRADQRRLRQLFENLFRNSVEHGSTGNRPEADDGIEHGSARRDAPATGAGTVTVTVGELEDGFYVKDDGPGIPFDERDHVFEFGYSNSREGTGFGLSIVKQVVEAHDWSIRVTDGTEGGARFEITGVALAD